MTVFGSFDVGISGLQAQSNKIGIISDNIANQNTVGYKASVADFHTLVSHFDTAPAPTYSPGGVYGAADQTIQQQGTVTRTDSVTDIAITGNGFFPVSYTSTATDKNLYTRAGSFSPDSNGYLVNSNKFFLKAWALDKNGNLDTTLAADSVAASAGGPALVPVKIPGTDGVAVPTDGIAIQATLKSSQSATANSTSDIITNLNPTQAALPTATIALAGNVQSTETAFTPASAYDPTDPTKNISGGNVSANFTDKIGIIDNTGAARTVDVSYLKTAPNTWAVEIHVQPYQDVTEPNGLLASGTVTFNPDGSLATVSPALTAPITATWNNAGGATTLGFNFGTVGKSDGVMQSVEDYTELANVQPDYDPASLTKSMASGGVAPQYTRSISVLDNTGTAHNLTLSFVKTAADTWAVEVYDPVTSEINTPVGGVPGQVATGSVTFNSLGALATVSPSLLNPVSIDWTGSTQPTTTSFNVGTIGTTDGLAELGTSYTMTATTPKENYSPIISANSMASGAVIPNYSRDIDVVDQDGVKRTLTVGFLKTAPNTWAVEVYAKNASEVTTTDGQVAYGNLTFNGDGTLNSISPSLAGALPVAWTTGDPSAITVNWGTAGPQYGTPGAIISGKSDGLSQVDAQYSIEQITVNGSVVGKLSNVAIDKDGYVTALYDNTVVRKLYKIPLAVFHDPNLLTQLTGNIFEESHDTGTPVYTQASKGGSGVIDPSSLESSNVEISGQLTDIVVAQRAYQSNTKIITTTDEMLQTLTQMLGT